MESELQDVFGVREDAVVGSKAVIGGPESVVGGPEAPDGCHEASVGCPEASVGGPASLVEVCPAPLGGYPGGVAGEASPGKSGDVSGLVVLCSAISCRVDCHVALAQLEGRSRPTGWRSLFHFWFPGIVLPALPSYCTRGTHSEFERFHGLTSRRSDALCWYYQHRASDVHLRKVLVLDWASASAGLRKLLVLD